MGLRLVATPIGNPQDLGLRALELLKSAEIIIVEEFKESTMILRAHGISGKPLEKLNEHSTREDLERLANLCAHQDVVLITDCGTPGFCDPGAHLVDVCRQKNILVQTVPGPSSIMGLLSLSSQRLDEFIFKGFLPAENSARSQAFQELKKEKKAIIIMDTPYRFQKMLQECEKTLPDRQMLLAINLTQENELILEGKAPDFLKHPRLPLKAEFLILIYPVSPHSGVRPVTRPTK